MMHNVLRVKINHPIFNELKRAAAECSSAADEPISAEEYAAEIIESYMASRRLEKICLGESFIDEMLPKISAMVEPLVM